MRRPILAGIVLFLGVGLFSAMFLPKGASQSSSLEPLVSSNSENATAALPAGAIVLTIAEGAEIKAPFKLQDDPSAAGGVSLALAEGNGSKDRAGKAVLNVEAAAAGSYQVWVRANWRDSCGNSISLKVGDAAERDIGNDAVYNSWHWINAGKHTLAAGKNVVSLLEREDGIAVDQVLFTIDAKYAPVGLITPAGEARGIRRFADDFSRSPGHGMEGWDLVSGKWNISFSFDPNRIPNQYALICEPSQSGNLTSDGNPAIALIKGAPWYGCRIAYTFFPEGDGTFGTVVDRRGNEQMQVGFELKGNTAKVFAKGSGASASADLKDRLRANQWHKVVIERWAWVTHVWLDDEIALRDYSAAPRAGDAGFFIASGKAVFDDIEVEEIPWHADNGTELTIPWTVAEGGEWFRSSGVCLPDAASKPMHRETIGRKGSLRAKLGTLPAEEIIYEVPEKSSGVAVSGPGLSPVWNNVSSKSDGYDVKVMRQPQFSNVGDPVLAPDGVTLKVDGNQEARLRRVAVRYGQRPLQKYSIGPYHFTEAEIEDPSDYLDFTPEEYQKMKASGEWGKLKREAKFKPLVGDWGEAESPWVRERGSWHIHNGVLNGAGPMALLRHAEESTSDMDLKFRVKFLDPRTVIEFELYNSPDPGVRVRFSGEKAQALPAGAATAALDLKLTGADWHEIVIRSVGSTIAAKIDKDDFKQATYNKGDGGRLLMKIWAGRAEYDDIECIIPKQTTSSGLYTFNRRETEWWRQGEWVDHGGIACILASSWISLNQKSGMGLIWHKRAFKDNVLAGFDLEENTEWYGWDKYPSHVHHAYEDVTVRLAPENTPPNSMAGYTLVVNAEEHASTILYRNDKPVAKVSQHTGNFPMRFVGGHAPFYPRRNRVTMVKRGNLIRGIVNGREVINFVDPEPIEVTRVGIGGKDTFANFSHIEVRELEAPIVPQPTGKETSDATNARPR